MADTAAPRRRRALPRVLFAVLLLLLLALATLLAVSTLDRKPPTDALPDGFSAYARVASAGDFFESILELETADVILATPQAAGARSLLEALRTEPFLRSRFFRALAKVRMDGALYGSSWLAVADLGIRSAVTRLAPFVIPWLDVPGLAFSRSGGVTRFTYKTGGTVVYAAARKNLLIASGDEALLERALPLSHASRDAQTAEILSRRAPKDLRILLRTAELLALPRNAGPGSSGNPLGRLLASLSLPGFAAVDLSAKNAFVRAELELPVSSEAPGLKPILSARSRPPAALSSLPEGAQYFSVLSAGTLEQLRDAALPLLGPEAEQAWSRADSASKAALGMDLVQLLLSWTGDEFGVYGLKGRAEKVFFVKVRDEARRRRVFQDVFETGALGEDDAVVLDGIRVPRVLFPWYLSALLSVLGAEIPQPYYMAEDNYLLLSSSAETLVAAVRDARAGKVLPRTDAWRALSEGIPADAAAMLYYSLDRSVPFFLQGQGALSIFLRQYDQGVASVRFSDGKMRLALSAVASGGRGTQEIPGFPLKAEGRPSGGIRAGKGEDRRTRLYWLEDGKNLVMYRPSSGTRKSMELDDSGYFTLETRPDGVVAAVWAVSKRGSVWRMDSDLTSAEGFPIATGARAAAAPTLAPLPGRDGSERGLLLPLKDGGVLTVSGTGQAGSIPVTFDSPLASPLACLDGILAAYPKSFEGRLWVLDSYGRSLDGWPATLSGIGYGSPLLVPLGSSFRVAFLTQAGEFSLWNDRGQGVPGFPVALEGVFYGTPIFAAGSFWAISESGILYRVGMAGEVDRLEVRGAGGKEPMLAAQDIDSDGDPEIFVSGEGNALYGFTSKLGALKGFPVPGSGLPAFADLNGDGSPELLSTGVDGTIRAVSFK